ncbi:MAG: DNA polymerase III subunit alpha [Planctomycetota bacterium]
MDASGHDPECSRLRARIAGRPLPLLAVRSTYSLLRGVVPPAAWGRALAGLYPPAHRGPWAVLADHDDLLGLPACSAAWGHERVAVGATLVLPGAEGPRLLLILAPERSGYARLCTLLSWRHEAAADWRAWLRSDAPPPLALDGLVCLIDDVAWGERLRRGGAEVYWRNHIRPQRCPSGFAAVAAPLLTHLSETTRPVEPVLAAMANGTTLPPRPPPGRGACLSQLPAILDAYAGREDQLARGQALLARCRHVPGAPVDGVPPLHLPPSRWADAPRLLRRLARAGACRRYGRPLSAAVAARLDHELGVIIAKGFAGYLLCVFELARGRRTCGRGSGAASLVCYCLGLTNVDPIRYRLVFERFLAPERIDPPDLDIDFPWDERDAVLAAAVHTYGRAHVAMVVTHNRLNERGALREVARVFGLSDHVISNVLDDLRLRRRFGAADAAEPPERAPPWPAILATAAAVRGAPRHLGLHCGGVVITPEPIRELVPVHDAAKRLADGSPVPAIAWEKDGAEAMGLVKIDLLGNRSLAVIRDALADLREDGVVIDTARWRPEDDPATRRLVATGATMGCFYIESPAMRQLQAKVGSGSFDRLVVHSSIIRPAANRWIATYLERHHHHRRTGRFEDDWFVHPCLRELLSETYGIISYQEDVMLVAQRMAGFDSAGANALRKALGKADTARRLAALSDAFHAGCRERGVEPAAAAAVWDMITSFSGYSFCKAHSASYAMVSFQCAWLKAHHPAHFLARVIANEGGFYHPTAYVEEARRCGVAIRGPDVGSSGWATRREGMGAIRLGLQLVAGLGQEAARRICAARAQAPFTGLRDLRHRCRLGSDELRALFAAGALDRLVAPQDIAARAWIVATVAREQLPPAGGAQTRLALGQPDAGDPRPPPLPSVDPVEHARRRHAALGLLPERHPFAVLWDLPDRRWRCAAITVACAGARVGVIARCITRKQVVATCEREGPAPRREPMAFVTLEDESGLLETVWFPEAYRRYGRLLEEADAPLAVSGRVQVDHGCVALMVESVRRWRPTPRRAPASVAR